MDRRQFIQWSSAAMAASTILPSRAEEKVAKSSEFKIRTSLKLNMVKMNGTLIDKFKLVKDLGFDGIEVDAPGQKVDDLIRARDAAAMPIHGVVNSKHWRFTLSDPSADVRAKGVAYLKEAIKTSKAIGGTTVLLVPGKVIKNKVSYDDCWKRSIIEIKKVLPYAKEQGIKIALENVWNNFLTTPKETLRYINELNSEMVGAYFDIGNSQRYTEKTHEWVKVLGSKIIKIDIKGYSLAQAKEQKDVWKGFKVKIGEGTVDWKDCVKELKKINYNSWATAEVKGGDKDRLKEIKANMDKVLSGK